MWWPFRLWLFWFWLHGSVAQKSYLCFSPSFSHRRRDFLLEEGAERCELLGTWLGEYPTPSKIQFITRLFPAALGLFPPQPNQVDILQM